MKVTYQTDFVPGIDRIIALYNSSGINRPTNDRNRIAQMYVHANLVVTAWDQDELIGISRSLTDFCYCCYLSDLAVKKEFQMKGIGRELIRLTKDKAGEQVSLILLAAPSAVDYYPKVGFDRIGNGFIIKRKK